MTTTDVDNWPADDKGIQGPELMERFQKHAERFRNDIVFDHIHTAQSERAPHPARGRRERVHLRRAHHRDRRVGPLISGSNRRSSFMGKGYRPAPPVTDSSTRGQDVAVVGGGNTAVEEALYLSNIARRVTVFTAGNKFRAEKFCKRSSSKKNNVLRPLEPRPRRGSGYAKGRPRHPRQGTFGPARGTSSTSMDCSSAVGHTPNTAFSTDS